MMDDAYTTIDGRLCKIHAFFDVDGDETDDTSVAVGMMFQFMEDIKPEGQAQTFRRIDFEAIELKPAN